MPKKAKPLSPTQNVSGDRNIVIGGDVNGVVIAGDNNTVNQTVIQKFFNIFRGDAETTEQRNRRIMLGHVENFWVKGILEKSLHGAALLELGIKEDTNALNYPWAIKREITQESLPSGTSMLEIFQEIGMGRSLLILGAPGSGKTTMLLELTRQLIEHARMDVTEPIPVVFNLSSWTEKLTLADWLARELNLIYSVPRKIAPTWVTENRMLLLLDGLDEVQQESRNQCVDAINQFRKENGLTSMAVCSRLQDYAELKKRLSFDGAIEIQPLTSSQVDLYFDRFGKGLAGIRQVLEQDSVLREMAETPLFLSIMTLAYYGKSADVLASQNLNTVETRRKHLFDTYIRQMFERVARAKRELYTLEQTKRWLAWLAQKIIEHNAVPFLFENIQPQWLSLKTQRAYRLVFGLFFGVLSGLFVGPLAGLAMVPSEGPINGLLWGLFFLILGVLTSVLMVNITEGRKVDRFNKIDMIDTATWDRKKVKAGVLIGLLIGLLGGLIGARFGELRYGLIIGLLFGLAFVPVNGLKVKQVSQAAFPGQRIFLSVRIYFFVILIFGLTFGTSFALIFWLFFNRLSELTDLTTDSLKYVWIVGLLIGMLMGVFLGLVLTISVIQHYALRFILYSNRLLPKRLVPFLEYCTDHIFLRRVGGGYIFVHRLLMEHFAAMYPEVEK